MLDLTMGGRCVGGVDAVEFFERLADIFPAEIKTEEFCNEYEYALNRFRYEVQKSVPIAPKAHNGRFTYYTCGKCGSGVDRPIGRYCQKCGRAIDWEQLNRRTDGTTK